MRLPSSAIDNEILVVVCQDQCEMYRISVDDMRDKPENELTDNEIHLTFLRMDRHSGETPLPLCYRLSTTSAQELVRQLTEAIAKRGGLE